MLDRLGACAQRITDHENALKAERVRRDRLIREALDIGGHSFGQVAKAARRSKARCATIAGEAEDE